MHRFLWWQPVGCKLAAEGTRHACHHTAVKPPHSTPGAPYNNHTTDTRCATARCCHTARIYSDAAHANDWPPFGYATASLRFYVWERPCQAAMKARSCQKTTDRLTSDSLKMLKGRTPF